MKKNFQRIVCFLAVIIIGTSFMSGLNAAVISKPAEIDVTPSISVFSSDNIEILVQDDENLITIQYQLSEFSMDEVAIEETVYKQIKLADESNYMIKGKPDLPNICRSIIIPDNLKMDIKVTYSQFEEYEGVKIAPSKGNIKRTQNPDDVPYVFDEIYNEDTWFPGRVAELTDSYILRDFRGQVVKINPFQYNPTEEKLRFYTKINVEIYPIGVDTVNCISRTEPLSKIDTDFKTIYENHFINFETNSYSPVEEQGNMLVITYDSFWNSLLPFVQWKNMKGIPTEMVKVSEIGTANAIKEYIINLYSDKGLTFVLLVGDIQQIQTLHRSGDASDPSYSYVAGSDHYPDLFVGRFSAQTISQVETQVERSIKYEKNPQENADWYHKGTGIASGRGPGDDGEYDNEHIDYIREDLLNYTYTLVDQIYDPSATASQVTNALNDGRSIVNYCGHGSPFSWGSSGFNNGDINALINDNMLPFIWTVACNNGEFDSYDTCFAEAWLRATHNGEPAGAIAVFASSISQSWDPPMDAQDECVDLLVDSYENNKKYTFGGISFNGCMHMNDEYGYWGYEMTDTWHVFGDPSLQVRTDTPTPITVTHDPSIDMGATTFEIDVAEVEEAFCVVSRNYELFGAGYTDGNGHVIIEFKEPIPYGGDIDIVVTGKNTIPYIATIPIEGEDTPPDIPARPSGRRWGITNRSYIYTAKTIDPEEDLIYYMWDWGDGTFSDWIGPYESGGTIKTNHTWDEKGIYSVRVKAKDLYRAESDWSDPLTVKVPRSKTYFMSFSDLLEKHFPRLFSFFSYWS